MHNKVLENMMIEISELDDILAKIQSVKCDYIKLYEELIKKDDIKKRDIEKIILDNDSLKRKLQYISRLVAKRDANTKIMIELLQKEFVQY